jgi:hypothetical protein
MKYARIVDHLVVEIFEHATIRPEDVHPPEVVTLFVPVADNVDVGWSNATGELLPPPIVEVAEFVEPPKHILPISPVEFKLRFTAQERVGIYASKDPIIVDWLRILDDQRLTQVDVSLDSTKDAVNYLVSLKLIDSKRVDDLLAPNFIS